MHESYILTGQVMDKERSTNGRCHTSNGCTTDKTNTVRHFSYAPLVQCKITRKRNVIFVF